MWTPPAPGEEGAGRLSVIVTTGASPRGKTIHLGGGKNAFLDNKELYLLFKNHPNPLQGSSRSSPDKHNKTGTQLLKTQPGRAKQAGKVLKWPALLEQAGCSQGPSHHSEGGVPLCCSWWGTCCPGAQVQGQCGAGRGRWGGLGSWQGVWGPGLELPAPAAWPHKLRGPLDRDFLP